MSRKYLALSSRIKTELSDIEAVVKRITGGWERLQATGDDYYLDSVALNLHTFYSALERIFTLIAMDIDGAIPEGLSWHQDLLIQMKVEIKKIRPAVLSQETYQMLDEYRAFRHVVRNVYTFNLSCDKIAPLVNNIGSLFTRLKREMEQFVRFLEEAGESN